jgi:small subunit ribosomal protein S16
MAVSIRLRREGARNRPYYKVVVADSRSPRDGKFIEMLGTYDPKKPDHNSTLKLDRIDHWISQGAQPSDTVRSLIKKNKEQPASAPPEVAAPSASPDEPAAAVESAAPAAIADEPSVKAEPESAAPVPVQEEPAAAPESPATPPPLPE